MIQNTLANICLPKYSEMVGTITALIEYYENNSIIYILHYGLDYKLFNDIYLLYTCCWWSYSSWS